MDNLENQEYDSFMSKLNLKITELRNDYQNLSEQNKRRFSQDLQMFLKQQGITITAQAIYNLMVYKRNY